MERRDFIKMLAAISVQPTLAHALATKSVGQIDKGTILICLQDATRKRTVVREFDWNTHASTDHFVSCEYPHSIMQDEKDRSVVHVFETFGSSARYDMTTKKEIKIDHRDGKEMSYGHGIQTLSGRLLCTQFAASKSYSVIVAKDPKTLKTIAKMPEACEGAHQLARLPGSGLIVCGTHGNHETASGGVTFFDGDTGKVVRAVSLPSSIIHVFPISSEEVIALGIATAGTESPKAKYEKSTEENQPARETLKEYRSAPIYSVKLDGKFETFDSSSIDDELKFNFSFAQVPKTELLITTHLASGRMIVWKGEKPFKTFNLPGPTNLKMSADGSEFMVATGGYIKIYSAKTFEEVKVLKDDYVAIGFSSYLA